MSQPMGIRSNLKKIEDAEGAQVALNLAYRWQAVLEEIRDAACPTLNDPRPGGSQRFCAELLLLRVNQYIEKNPLAPKCIDEDSIPDAESTVEPPNPDDLGEGV